MSSTFKHLPLLAACFLGSCMVGPDFRTPTNDLPATWEANRPPHSSDKDLRSWWNIFGDPQLNRLVSTSLNNNPDMKVALLRIREAREKLRVSQASLLHSIREKHHVSPLLSVCGAWDLRVWACGRI